MYPVIAIVGRPNVGKSTLFNILTKSRSAIVADQPGLTRDRQYGIGKYNNKEFIIIDTGGIGDKQDEIDNLMAQQTILAIEEADVIVFIVDAKAGLTAADELLVQRLRTYSKKVFLVLNKIDGLDQDLVTSEFYSLGFGTPIPIAAAHNRGIKQLLTTVLADFPEEMTTEEKQSEQQGIKVAIVGRPNVGKSTLINKILGERRVTVFDKPGTTRDSIFIPFQRNGKQYTLIDTAGVRRRSKITDTVEKFSVIKTLQAIENCNVVVFLIDGREKIAEQDLKLLSFILDAGKAIVIAVNKWDSLSSTEKELNKKELQRRLTFIDYAKWHFISALHGTGVKNLFTDINKVYQAAYKQIDTNKLTKLLIQAQEKYQPPLIKGRRLKLRYAHLGGHNPPIIVIHGNQAILALPYPYKRYLERFYRQHLKLEGTPIRIELNASENPYVKKK